MKYSVFLPILCIFVITCCFTVGCDRIRKPTNISETLGQIDDIPSDPDGPVPVLPQIAEIEPGKYRMRVNPAMIGEEEGKIYRLLYAVNDRAQGCVAVEILLNPSPKYRASDGQIVLNPNGGADGSVFDAVVIEIKAKKDVSPRLLPEEPELAPSPYLADPQEACTVHVYEGRLIKNLSDPHVVFEYDEDALDG